MTAIVTVWSDVHCPWALVAVHRLRAARAARGLDVVLDQRAWPLELINKGGIPRHIVQPEMAVLSNHEPDLFGVYDAPSYPSTSMPAFELVAAARRAGGPAVAEEVDYQVRLAFFRDSVDISVRSGLERVLDAAAEALPAVDPAKIFEVWESEPVRADVLADYRRSRDLPIQGSPQIFWPDRTTTHNPGMTDHEWLRGIPRLRSADPGAAGRLLDASVTRVTSGRLDA
ncbi:DsbA family protein [Micromonospora sp. CA-240977]|uniref:DsbA family protein n=1 Tax=Micromonospora sp. CA-240977 TaxID=3239957 RepID=UPI003D8BF0BC